MTNDENTNNALAAADVTVTDHSPIQLTFRDANNNSLTFKLKMSTRMENVKAAFARQLGVELIGLRFLSPEGVRIKAADTPTSLQLENEDGIDVFTEQIGGGGALVARG